MCTSRVRLPLTYSPGTLTFLCVVVRPRQKYDDIPCVVDNDAERFLVENGVDAALAYHVAHLFAR